MKSLTEYDYTDLGVNEFAWFATGYEVSTCCYIGHVLMRIDWILTRIYPLKPGDHAHARFRELFQQTLETLNGIKIRVLYLHAPDHTVPFEETVSVVNDLYKEGHL